jgi:hypothetical protein
LFYLLIRDPTYIYLYTHPISFYFPSSYVTLFAHRRG